MSHEENPATLTDRAVRLRAEGIKNNEPITYQQLVGVDIEVEELAELWLSLQEYQRAAKTALDAIGQELGEALDVAGHGVTIGEDWVYFKPRKSSRITDPDGFWEWMKANPDLLEAAFNPNNIRKTGIPASVLDTFFEVVESPSPVVSTVPVHVLERNQAKKGQT